MEWGKNNKSIVSGSETIDGGLPSVSLTRVLGISGLSLTGNSLSQQISPTFLILPVGDGFVHVVYFGESSIPGWVPSAQDKEPQPSNTAEGPGEASEAGGSGSGGL